MPELPDVEAYRRIVEDCGLDRPIEAVEAPVARLLDDVTADDLDRRLTGSCFIGTARHGKYLFATVGEAGWLVLHFGMTGRILALDDPADAPEGSGLLVRFRDGGALAYHAPRKFGRIAWTENPAVFARAHGLGRDAFEPRLPPEVLAVRLRAHSGMVKAVLTDQSVLAGIGNVYADEALFQAGIHPKARADRLDDREVKALARSLHHVCDLAIRHEADPDAMPDGWLLPHRAAGDPCPRCGAELAQTKVSGRTTVFCPKCQPEP